MRMSNPADNEPRATRHLPLLIVQLLETPGDRVMPPLPVGRIAGVSLARSRCDEGRVLWPSELHRPSVMPPSQSRQRAEAAGCAYQIERGDLFPLDWRVKRLGVVVLRHGLRNEQRGRRVLEGGPLCPRRAILCLLGGRSEETGNCALCWMGQSNAGGPSRRIPHSR